MVANTNIKFYVHTNAGAPQLTNESGKLIDVLDACLINGFGSQVVNSLTANGTTVTATFSSAHNLMRFQVIRIKGSNQTEYNGEHSIVSIPNATSLTFELAALPGTTTATGTITCDLAPLGWELPFSAQGRRAYKSPIAGSPYLRVIDEVDPIWPTTYAKFARVGICENMGDINNIIGHQAPYDPLKPNKNWVMDSAGGDLVSGWAKWFFATSQPETNPNALNYQTPANGSRSWTVVGDGQTFYIFNRTTTTGNETPIAHGFGVLKNMSKIGANAQFLACCDNPGGTNTANAFGFSALTNTSSDNNNKLFLLRNYKGEAIASPGLSRVFSGDLTTELSGANAKFPAPTSDISIFSSEYLIVETTTTPPIPRGMVPHLRWLHQVTPYAHLESFIENGRKFLAIKCAAQRVVGQVLVDLGDI